MPSVLIILGSSMTALAVLRDAVRHGLTVLLLDVDDGPACHSRWGVKLIRPGASADELLPELLRLAGPHSALIATSDYWLEFLMRHRPALDQAFAAVLHPANPALEICLHKELFVPWCRTHGLPTPVTWFVGAERRPPGLVCPVILRPAHTRHQGAPNGLIPKAVEVQDEAELTRWLAIYASQGCAAVASTSLLRRRLLQYSIAYAAPARGPGEEGKTAAQAGVLAFVTCKRRPLPDRCSVGTFVELSPQADVLALGRAVVERLGLTGIGEIEVLHDADTGENFLIEVNARPWMQYALAPASGHEFLTTVLGGAVQASMHRPHRLRGHGWVELKPDLFNAFSSRNGAVRKGEIGLASYLLSLLRMNVYARFDWRDPWPGLLGWRRSTRANSVSARLT
jgi:predicted ATP-grasp superfamily ATP-dependent carboligase